MSSPFATPPASSHATTRTRVKWDNIMIVLIGTVVAAFAVVGILASGGSSSPKAGTTHKAAPSAIEAPADEPTTINSGALTLDDSTGLVVEARDLLATARFDEAIDRLQTVPAEYQDVTGAAQLLATATTNKARYATLHEQLDAAVEARQFADAAKLIQAMLAIAPNDPALKQAQELVGDGTTPAAAQHTTRTPAKAATTSHHATGGGTSGGTKASSTGGGATSPTSRPASNPTKTPSRPVSGGGATQPTAPTSGTNTPTSTSVTGSATGTGVAGLDASTLAGGLQLTQAQQQELEQALQAALGDAGL
jgi:hypothetical protein